MDEGGKWVKINKQTLTRPSTGGPRPKPNSVTLSATKAKERKDAEIKKLTRIVKVISESIALNQNI
jgi:hypothetical protein